MGESYGRVKIPDYLLAPVIEISWQICSIVTWPVTRDACNTCEDAGLEAAAADGELGAGAHPRVLHEDLAPEAGPRHPRAGDQRVGHKENF